MKALKALFIHFIGAAHLSMAELEFGGACSGDALARNRAALNSLLEDIVVRPFEAGAARAHGPVRMTSRERQKDALALGLTLVTNSEGDFRGYAGLVVENWVNTH